MPDAKLRRVLPDGYWTQPRIIAALQKYAERYGEPPSAMGLNIATARRNNRQDLIDRFYKDGDYPHYGTVIRRFGTFSKAIETAGFTPMRPGQRRTQRPRDPA